MREVGKRQAKRNETRMATYYADSVGCALSQARRQPSYVCTCHTDEPWQRVRSRNHIYTVQCKQIEELAIVEPL